MCLVAMPIDKVLPMSLRGGAGFPTTLEIIREIEMFSREISMKRLELII